MRKGLHTDVGRYCCYNCLLYTKVNRLLRVTLIINGGRPMCVFLTAEHENGSHEVLLANAEH